MMGRQISYNWLPEEARAIAVDQYVEGFLNFRVLTAIALLFYLPLIVQAYWANPEFYMHPLFLVILLGPVAIYALEYWRYLKNASSPEGKWGVVGAPVTFSWDDKGFEVSCDGNGFRLDWSNF
ncbi:MAG: hypothetical protein C0471_08480, partial [Erythrobacter sp.]|nr:hypothetical protein [Erythrobacter sp.]